MPKTKKQLRNWEKLLNDLDKAFARAIPTYKYKPIKLYKRKGEQ